ncbi:hypothetical protein Nepgr_033093 [Nepenthes gracilis]|uniref:Uncharacterized protein n=1 Tax=Nepenthes gracilis TaxID=150966 RepID=A0AAD3TJW9_NEPGR|nr:hypothetical protein Nepgr_033093 [Nepenthes gracilis]
MGQDMGPNTSPPFLGWPVAFEKELDGSVECLKLLKKTVVTLVLQFAFCINESGSAILLSPRAPFPVLSHVSCRGANHGRVSRSVALRGSGVSHRTFPECLPDLGASRTLMDWTLATFTKGCSAPPNQSARRTTDGFYRGDLTQIAFAQLIWDVVQEHTGLRTVVFFRLSCSHVVVDLVLSTRNALPTSPSSTHASRVFREPTPVGARSSHDCTGPSCSWERLRFREGPPRRGAAAAEVEWLRARVAHLESAWAELEARATRLVGANVGAQARILALEGEAEQLKRRHEAEVAGLRAEARITRLIDADVDAQARTLALEVEIERLKKRHEAEAAELRSELRTRLRPEGVNLALEQTYFDAVRLCRRLASLEDPGFCVVVLDPRNSLPRTRDQLVDYHVQSSSTGHWDH